MTKIKILLGMLILFGLLETGTRFYHRIELQHMEPMPQTMEAYGNFENFMQLGNRLTAIQDQLDGPAGRYMPRTILENRPNYKVSFSNFDTQFDSMGFRHQEVVMPKPPDVYRVFILGGSTIAGGPNEEWTISYYLENDLKVTNPHVEVINAGVQAYASQHELILLETKVINLDPDLVIVLDGRNDLFYAAMPNLDPAIRIQQILDAVMNRPKPLTIAGYALDASVRKSSFLLGLYRTLFNHQWPHVHPVKVEFNPQAIDGYLNNLAMIKSILEARHVRGLLVFQPTLGYGKPRVTPYERSVIDYLANQEKTDWILQAAKIWPLVGKRVAEMPQSSLVKTCDFSKVFEHDPETAYSDSCHYVPNSCKLLADLLAAAIKHNFLISANLPK